MPTIEEAIREAERALIPPPKLRMSEWIEAEGQKDKGVVIPDGVSKLPGKLRLSPLQREIADAIGDRSIERVTMVKPVRVGFTTLITATIAGFVANDPTSIMVVLPTEDDCRGYMVDDVEPIFAESPEVAGVLADDQPEGERNTILSRRFPGGSLKVKAGKSPRNLRRHNVDVLYLDELDAMEVTNEGPVDILAEKRTFNSPDRKIIKGSTPVYLETSLILKAYAQSDQRIFEVPCPECGAFHEILWDQIRWDKAEDGRHLPETAHWICPSCGCVVEEKHKPALVEAGRCRATRPEVKGHAGFRANALISTQANAAWGKLAEEFLAAAKDPAALQVFTNTILGQGWRGEGEDIDADALEQRRESWSLEDVPEEVLALTLGVDVQDDRLECTALGWSESGAMFVLGHHVIDGRYDEDETWQEIDEFIGRKWSHRLGGSIGFDAVCVDAGSGLHMPHVLAFCRPRARRRVMAIKGEDGFKRQLIVRSATKDKLWIVGSDAGKQQIMGRLGHLPPPLEEGAEDRFRHAMVRFSGTLTPNWFEQLASERKVARYVAGKPTFRFERVPGRRAEALDCVVYGMAARQMIAVDWGRRRVDLSMVEPVRGSRPAAPQQQGAAKPWLTRRDKWL